MKGTIILAFILTSCKHVTSTLATQATTRDYDYGMNIPNITGGGVIGGSGGVGVVIGGGVGVGSGGGIVLNPLYTQTTTGKTTPDDSFESHKNFMIYFLEVVSSSLNIVSSRLKSDTLTTTTAMPTTVNNYCYFYYIQSDYYNATSYYICINNTLLHKQCPDGGQFDRQTLTCGGNCIDGLVEAIPDPKPLFSSKYRECVGANWVEKTCPPSSYFDMYYNSLPCINFTCNSIGNMIQADPLDRTKYLSCDPKINSWVENSCGVGQVFDRFLQECVNAKCTEGDTTALYHFWDAMYSECGQVKVCPNQNKFWYSLGQCVGSKSDLTTTSIPTTKSSAISTKTSPNNPTAVSSFENMPCSSYGFVPPYDFLGYYQYSKYFQCEGGQWKIENCPPQSTFYLSPVGGYCAVYEMCPYATKKNFIRPPKELPNLKNNGSLYYECRGSSWYLSVCPIGETFNPNEMNCSPTPNNYKNGVPLCAIGTKMSFEGNAQFYYECDGFSWVAKMCPPSSMFNPDTNSCNYNCTAGTKMQLVDNDYYNDGSFYLECNGSSWVLKKCPLKLIFNVYSLACSPYLPPKPTPKTTSNTTTRPSTKPGLQIFKKD